MFQSSSRGVASFILYFPRPPYVPKVLFDELIESILTGEGLDYSHLTFLSENILLSLDSLDSRVEVSEAIVSIISSVDNIYISLNGDVIDSISLTSSLVDLQNKIEEINELLSVNSSFSERVVYLTLLTETLRIMDLVDYGKFVSISESLLYQDLVNTLGKLSNSLLDSILPTDSLSPASLRFTSLSENFSLVNTLSSLLTGKEKVTESFVISIPTASGQNNYLAYLLSPETMSVSNYNNYNFDGGTEFNGKYYFFNSTGLYEYGGDRDNGDKIKSYIETVAFNFGSSNLKQVPSVYLGWTSSDSFYLKVKTDGKKEAHYKLNKRTENIHTQKIDIGKGLISRYFQFELVTDADEFSMESIDFYPVELRRKL